ncbi:MAG: hypothetical protein AAF202_03735, partial [Pseudomonadota bacterium]
MLLGLPHFASLANPYQRRGHRVRCSNEIGRSGPKRLRKADRAFSSLSKASQAYFTNGERYYELPRTDIWIADFLRGKREALQALHYVINLANNKMSTLSFYAETPPSVVEVIRALQLADAQKITNLRADYAISLADLYNNYNLIPPAFMIERISEALLYQFDNWRPREFDKFSFLRMHMPFQFTEAFESAYLERLKTLDTTLGPTSFSQAVIPELYRSSMSGIDPENLQHLARQFFGVLAERKDLKLHTERLKEAFRAIGYLVTRQDVITPEEYAKAALGIQAQLNMQEDPRRRIQLSQGGAAGTSDQRVLGNDNEHMIRIISLLD